MKHFDFYLLGWALALGVFVLALALTNPGALLFLAALLSVPAVLYLKAISNRN